MNDSRQDPIDEIEQAVVALRHFRPRGAGPRGGFGGGREHGAPPQHHDEGLDRMPMGRGIRGPHDRPLGGAARVRLLATLREQGSMSVSEIAEAIGVDQPRASRLVNDSAQRGLVSRRADDRDARRSVVQLTEAGRTMLATATASRRTAVEDAVADFTPEETATFAALFTRFVAGWTQHEGGHGPR